MPPISPHSLPNLYCMYLNSPLLATVYTLYKARYQPTLTYTTYNVCVCVCVYTHTHIHIHLHIYTHRHNQGLAKANGSETRSLLLAY